jgi:hypothetical protein
LITETWCHPQFETEQSSFFPELPYFLATRLAASSGRSGVLANWKETKKVLFCSLYSTRLDILLLIYRENRLGEVLGLPILPLLQMQAFQGGNNTAAFCY